MTGTVAVTGGTGFVGSHLVERLCADGWRVRLLARRVPVHPLFAARTVEAVIGDLDDGQALAALVRGAEAVVHGAGLIKARHAAEFHRVNAGGTAALAAAAARVNPAPRFVLISSLAAREPTLSAYAASKRAGEQALAAQAPAVPAAVLRPPVVYGPGDRETLAIFRAAAMGLAPVLRGGDRRVSLLHVADLADACSRLLAADRAAVSGTFEIDDGRDGGYSWSEIMAFAAAAAGRRALTLPIPPGLLVGAAWLCAATGRLRDRPAMLTPSKVREMCHADWVCRDRSLELAAGWRPRVAAGEGFATTYAWYRSAGWLHPGGHRRP